MSAATIETVQRFEEAFNSHDVDAVTALRTDACPFDVGPHRGFPP